MPDTSEADDADDRGLISWPCGWMNGTQRHKDTEKLLVSVKLKKKNSVSLCTKKEKKLRSSVTSASSACHCTHRKEHTHYFLIFNSQFLI